MLACARLGAIHSVVFGGFAANELASRIEDAQAEGRSSRPHAGSSRRASSSYKPLLDAAIDMAESKPQRCISCSSGPCSRPRSIRDRDVEWNAALAGSRRRRLASRWMQPIRSTSSTRPGTTGTAEGNRPRQRRPRGRARLDDDATSTTSIRARSTGPPPTSAGSVGHSYIVYAPLFHGCTTVLYEGKPVGTPDAGAFWRVIAQHGVCDALHGADGLPRDPSAGPGRRADRTLRPRRVSARCSSPASAATPRRSRWAEQQAAACR